MADVRYWLVDLRTRISAGLDCFDMADHYGDAGE
jgi:hypothetical protein